ncbi:zinc finger SWIM domain-containing protein 7 isoform X1 [Anolis carolinensis]|uniref:zinc finger SWIM domain-containing protein 7 isoform X1 n=1 Tax=Anolis carolinensis TaxID=28377 RepID=UPI002F2B7CF8
MHVCIFISRPQWRWMCIFYHVSGGGCMLAYLHQISVEVDVYLLSPQWRWMYVCIFISRPQWRWIHVFIFASDLSGGGCTFVYLHQTSVEVDACFHLLLLFLLLLQVSGSSGKLYTCYASCHFCSCPAFTFSVLRKGERLVCKHILAIYLSRALGACTELTVQEQQLSKLLLPQEEAGKEGHP